MDKFYELAEKIKLHDVMRYTIVALIVVPSLMLGIENMGVPPTVNLLGTQAYLSWIATNTSQNATFLTLWQDGSAIEGWSHRASYTDSVVGQLGPGIFGFAHFLYAHAGNFSYLHQINPNYLLIRRYWLNYSGGIAVEGNVSANATLNNTNFRALESCTSNTNLSVVYDFNGTCIYAWLPSPTR